MNYCPRCGTKVTGDFCTTCGNPTSVTAAVTQSPVQTGTPVLASTETASNHEETTNLEGVEGPGPNERSRLPGSAVQPAGVALPQGHTRRMLVWETRVVMFAFLVTGVVSAVLVLIQHESGVGDISRFPVIVHSNPVLNMLLGMLAYVPVLAIVPLALFLLARTGQTPSVLGIGLPTFKRDILPALGLGAAAFGIELLLLVPFAAVIDHHPGLVNNVTVTSQPKYYLIEAIFMSAITAITEEVLVNGYFITRLGQLGWTPRSSLILSLALRTSYHVYYGLGFLLTIPLGYFVTRSFQKHHKLNRPIMAHFLYDAILFTISILK